MLSLEVRVRHLQAKLPDFSENLKFAWSYISSDAPSSLTKIRLIMEAALARIYQTEMGCEPKKPLLGEMLADNQFTRKLGRRIVVRMNSIREMGNLGAHGITVGPDDAIRAIDDLCTVLEWYAPRYSNGSAEPGSDRDRPEMAAASPHVPQAAPDVPAQAVLSFLASNGQEASIVVGQAPAAVAGRLPGLAIVFDHPTVSKRHAEFRMSSEGLVVYDLDSKNHIFVNGQPVASSLLNRGDTVQLSTVGPIITVVEAPVAWPQTASDIVRTRPSSPPELARTDATSPAGPVVDITEVDEPAKEVLARAFRRP